MQCILMAKHRFLQRHLNQPQPNPSIPERRVWQIDLWFGIDGLYFSYLLIFVLGLLNFQINPSICFSFRFGPCFFYYYLFYLELFIKLIFFSISSLFDFFHLLDLVIILFIVVAPDITAVLKIQWKTNITNF
jgi:hypothetical protein